MTPAELHVGVSRLRQVRGEGLNWKSPSNRLTRVFRAREDRTRSKTDEKPRVRVQSQFQKQSSKSAANHCEPQRGQPVLQRTAHINDGGALLRSFGHPEPPVLLIGVLILLAVNTYVVWQWRHPEDRNEWFSAKLIVVLSMLASELVIIGLPLGREQQPRE